MKKLMTNGSHSTSYNGLRGCCVTSRLEHFVISCAVVAPVQFTVFLLLVFRRPLRKIAADQLGFFANTQRLLLSLDAAELWLQLAVLANGRLFGWARHRWPGDGWDPLPFHLFYASLQATQLITRLVLVGLTLFRLAGIRTPLRFVGLNELRLLRRLTSGSLLVTSALHLAIYVHVWSGPIPEGLSLGESRRQLLRRFDKTWALSLASLLLADSLLAPLALALAATLRKRHQQKQMLGSTAGQKNEKPGSIRRRERKIPISRSLGRD